MRNPTLFCLPTYLGPAGESETDDRLNLLVHNTRSLSSRLGNIFREDPHELMIVVNGNTEPIISQLKSALSDSKNITVDVCAPGRALAMNKGLEKARNESYPNIVFVDDYHFYPTDTVRRAVRHLETHPVVSSPRLPFDFVNPRFRQDAAFFNKHYYFSETARSLFYYHYLERQDKSYGCFMGIGCDLIRNGFTFPDIQCDDGWLTTIHRTLYDGKYPFVDPETKVFYYPVDDEEVAVNITARHLINRLSLVDHVKSLSPEQIISLYPPLGMKDGWYEKLQTYAAEYSTLPHTPDEIKAEIRMLKHAKEAELKILHRELYLAALERVSHEKTINDGSLWQREGKPTSIKCYPLLKNKER